MKKKYNDIEKAIIKINPMYKSSIDAFKDIDCKYTKDELYKDYTGKENDLLILLYYRTLLKVYKELEKIGSFKNFDDIVSSVTVKVAEYIFARNSISNIYSLLARYVKTVMKETSPAIVNCVPLSHCNDLKSNYTMDETYCEKEVVDKVSSIVNERLTVREQKIIEDVMDGLTLEQMGDKYGVTSNRARQIREKAFRKIRYRMVNFFSNPVIKKSTKVSSSAGITFSTGPAKSFSFIEGKFPKRYINSFDQIYDIKTKDIAGSTKENRSKLFDGIAVGRFCLGNFEKPELLYNFYKYIRYFKGLANHFYIFKKFINFSYNATAEYSRLEDPYRLDIEATLFHAYYTSLEFAIENENAFSGYLMYKNIMKEYDFSRYIYPINADGYSEFDIIDHLSLSMKIHYSAMNDYLYNINVFRSDDDLVDYIKGTNFYNKYRKFETIIDYDSVELSSDINIYSMSTYWSSVKRVRYSQMIKAVIENKLSFKQLQEVINVLLKNYIINQQVADKWLEKESEDKNER